MSTKFYDALARAGSALIAEIKPSSPKVGPLLATTSVAAVAREYQMAGAPCLSVTTGAWHGGNLAMISEMARTGLPVLRKDFITSKRHLEDTRDAGASAALLTCTLLRKADVIRLAQDALAMQLTPFVEVASAAELDGLKLPDGAILAINNRDIRSKETDDGGIETGRALYAAARSVHDGLLISASGLLVPEDVKIAKVIGFDGYLVGTALLSGPHSPFETACRFIEAANTKIEAAE
ncbi:indole-3-glycerol-phosphate synthase [Litoreibacter janthinus]|uniref:indole-3-glycerol-phosphate synthase n=1 Tax=Litoreibacter janthinus TaxID=670154 RepID=A0A1I6GD58_9RHOB|nr:indole-3-glycerol-phosphate synthase [Litoreibacter janthinus]SFR40154.1 indole-3-glycerol phosphate synthase [Litoreibacter janthinus]